MAFWLWQTAIPSIHPDSLSRALMSWGSLSGLIFRVWAPNVKGKLCVVNAVLPWSAMPAVTDSMKHSFPSSRVTLFDLQVALKCSHNPCSTQILLYHLLNVLHLPGLNCTLGCEPCSSLQELQIYTQLPLMYTYHLEGKEPPSMSTYMTTFLGPSVSTVHQYSRI